MRCPHCAVDNRSDARFCRACGTPLAGLLPAAPDPPPAILAVLPPEPATPPSADAAAGEEMPPAPDVAAAGETPAAQTADTAAGEEMPPAPAPDVAPAAGEEMPAADVAAATAEEMSPASAAADAANAGEWPAESRPPEFAAAGPGPAAEPAGPSTPALPAGAAVADPPAASLDAAPGAALPDAPVEPPLTDTSMAPASDPPEPDLLAAPGDPPAGEPDAPTLAPGDPPAGSAGAPATGAAAPAEPDAAPAMMPAPFDLPAPADSAPAADSPAAPDDGLPAPAEAAAALAPPAPGLDSEAPTTQLVESEAPAVAPPVPGEEFPALAVSAIIAGRYQVQQVLQTGPQRQTYQVLDLQGYLRCWACGSRQNIQGELYCTDCGAQLTGRTYRLLETPPDAPLPQIPAPLLENMHSGVTGVFDSSTDPATGRHYLVLEDVGGQPVSAWLPAAGSAAAGSAAPQEAAPGETRLLSWIHQAAETLRELHAARIVGCDFTPQALQVLPDDRLVLVDPTACRMAGTVGDARGPQAEEQADVQRVAAGLEQWYETLQGAGGPGAPPEPGTLAGVLAHGREGGYPTAAEFAAAVQDLVAATIPPSDLQLISGRASDVGLQRKLNEDSLFALEFVTAESTGYTPTGLYIVADGMGGHENGEVASSIAVRTIPAMLHGVLESRISGEALPADPHTLGQLLREAILEANSRITQLSR
ncbi:MAG TPA: zinc-ribbon domain-containing protein, partial [Chloroflexia bacterium]|nr:zinc-ribbon domain-containing protein [Chloroflexia bacterium]